MENLIIKNTKGEQIILGNQAPFYLEKIDEALGVDIESQKSPKQDGSTYIDNTLGIRAISIEGIIITRNEPRKVAEYKRKMERVLNPKLGEVTILHQGKEIKAVVETTPIFPSSEGSRGLFYQKYLIHLICHNPFWVDSFTESREMSYLMGGIKFNLRLPTNFSNRGFRRKCINDGDVATPVIIEFNGPATNPTVINMTTGEFIRVNRSLGEDDVLSISTTFGEKYVRINGDNAFHYIDLDSVFWSLTPGDNILSYESNNDSIKTRVTVKWRNRYI
ncbi:phage tail family protein [Maledivibacter halophilus]|uniref:Phage tail protein n=1 Tax=Maledivibacter halophilus TaxID=36842 RepID=A0A1T5K1P5_9FIRM|nr:phage tail family protein [Maledivibacter halophilus]SKC57571.1 Phage tail protein [Maledivibacter halophilus]